MTLTESLTVEISADTTELASEIERAGALIDGLSSRLEAVTGQVGSAGGTLSGFGRATGPIGQVEQALGRVTSQLSLIGQSRVTIDVRSALTSLGSLSSMLTRVIGQLTQLSTLSMPVRGPTFGPLQGPATASPTGGRATGPAPFGGSPRFADGGYVTGPRGDDRVAAFVSAGEFVVRPEAVSRVGRPFLEQLNAGQLSPVSTRNALLPGQRPRFLGSDAGGRSATGHDRTLGVSSRRLSEAVLEPFVQHIAIEMSHAVELDDVLDRVHAARSRRRMRMG